MALQLDLPVPTPGVDVALATRLAAHPAVRACRIEVIGEGEVATVVAHVVLAPEVIAPLAQNRIVRQWSMVFDRLHAGSSDGASSAAGPGFAGWTSSWTDEPYTLDEMIAWRDATLARIRQTRRMRVLELGCGNGLLTDALARGTHHYRASDPSEVAIAALRERIRNDPALNHVETRVHAAHETVQEAAWQRAQGQATPFDLVILNSVVQYFPDRDYLESVLTDAWACLAPGGCIFVGDVRDLRLHSVLHEARALYRADAAEPAALVRLRARAAAALDPELSVRPALFVQSAIRHGGIAQILRRLEEGDTEMSRFRFDALLQKQPDGPRILPGTSLAQPGPVEQKHVSSTLLANQPTRARAIGKVLDELRVIAGALPLLIVPS